MYGLVTMICTAVSCNRGHGVEDGVGSFTLFVVSKSVCDEIAWMVKDLAQTIMTISMHARRGASAVDYDPCSR
jgi:hypothetical protein